MEGGMHAWEGLTAEGPPDFGMAYFDQSEKPDELLALAWILEDGSRKFYRALRSLFDDREAQDLFDMLIVAEEHHKQTLMTLYRQIINKEPGSGFPYDVVPTDNLGDVMEGGMSIREGIEWVKQHGLNSALELSISLEITAYDLYTKMMHLLADEKSKLVFSTLIKEEKQHLEKLATLLEKKV